MFGMHESVRLDCWKGFFSKNITSSMLICVAHGHVQVTKSVDSCVVQSTYPKGSLVELLHPQYDTEIVGKGRGGRHCVLEWEDALNYPMGAQFVVLTECTKEDVIPLLVVTIEPTPKNLEGTVGYEIMWPVEFLQMLRKPKQ